MEGLNFILGQRKYNYIYDGSRGMVGYIYLGCVGVANSLMIKIIAKLLRSSGSRFQFATNNSHILELNRELLQHYRTYHPWKSVRIMHTITMAKYKINQHTLSSD